MKNYMSAKDLKELIPTLGINKCLYYIKEIQKEMIDNNEFVPKTKPLIVPTEKVLKKFQIKKGT